MPGKGGWFKSYDEELDDPKIEDLNDEEFRVWRVCLDLCNRSPARLRYRGYLYHSRGYPVVPEYIARRLHKDPEAIRAAIVRLSEVGGSEASLLLVEDHNGCRNVLRIRAWRKRQSGFDEFPETSPDRPDDTAGKDKQTAAQSQEASPKRPRRVPKPSPNRPALDVDLDLDLDKDVYGGGGAAPEKAGTAPIAQPTPDRPTWPAEREALQALDGYPFDEAKDRAFMATLADAYPRIDIAAEIPRLKAWALSRDMLPLRGKRGPRQRLRNWISNAEEFAGRRPAGRPAGRTGPQERDRRPASAPAPASAFTETGEIKL